MGATEDECQQPRRSGQGTAGIIQVGVDCIFDACGQGAQMPGHKEWMGCGEGGVASLVWYWLRGQGLCRAVCSFDGKGVQGRGWLV